jgi:hypothetical protein
MPLYAEVTRAFFYLFKQCENNAQSHITFTSITVAKADFTFPTISILADSQMT